ncbi:MAG: Tim44/TimA family putative adaptor protein [Rickettsiales bacterium]|nr:Tim44/TimA family putative adaptor protein [Rickettsiales bacterium]
MAEEEKNQLLEALKTSNTEFDIFIEEIKFSFAKIVESFAKGDLKSLKELTSGLIFNNFEQAIMLRQNSKKILNSKIIAIDKVDIIKVNKKDDDFSVSIKFATRQINFVMDENNKVIDGAESQIINLIDNWAFAKNIKLNNSAWKLVATN